MSNDAPAPDVAASPARRIRWQWSVTTLLLLTAVVAAWVGWWQVRKQSVRLRSQIQAMQRLQRRLVIDDPQQFAIIEEHETWYDEDRWQVYLPAGREYRLKFATREVEERTLPKEAARDVPLAAGRHTIQLHVEKIKETGNWQIALFVDDEPAIRHCETPDWNSAGGSADNVGYARQQQSPVDQPLIVKRRRYAIRQANGTTATPQGPAQGILVWIE